MISAVFQDRCPRQIAIPFNHGVCASEIVRLLWIKCCVHSTEHHNCTLLSSQSANLIAAQCIAGVDSNSNHVPGRNAFHIQRFQCFVDDHRIAKAGGSSTGEHIEPARRDDANAEGLVTRINEISFQERFSDEAYSLVALVIISDILIPTRSLLYFMCSPPSVYVIRTYRRDRHIPSLRARRCRQE